MGPDIYPAKQIPGEKKSMLPLRNRIWPHFFWAAMLACAGLIGCKSAVVDKREYAWVCAPEAILRDRVAAVYNKTGIVHNGDRIQVLERMPRKAFVRVSTSQGNEGWVEQRFLAGQKTYDQLQQLAEQYKTAPTLISAFARDELKMHATPGKKTEYLHFLAEKQKVDLLERQIVDRNGGPMRKEGPHGEEEEENPGAKPAPPPVLEDWWLVRDSQKRVGWVLGRMLDVDVPIDVAQYAEGQRIVGFFKLDEAVDKNQKVSEYLTLLTENKDGLPYDFDQVRVFTWNLRAHRYETAFRQHNLFGVLPVVLGTEDFAGEGALRTFTLQLKDADGTVRERKFKFKSPRVQRALAPGEEPPATSHTKRHRR